MEITFPSESSVGSICPPPPFVAARALAPGSIVTILLDEPGRDTEGLAGDPRGVGVADEGGTEEGLETCSFNLRILYYQLVFRF